jgi:UDP-N-acetylglucosamine/UDP-N-acetylgalactosamine diphosphorylase
LAGGDSSRLGLPMPKGMFDPKIFEVKSIFELISLKIKKLSELCTLAHPEEGGLGRDKIVLVVMTNLHSHNRVVEFYRSHNNFGYPTTIFFPQGHLPVTDEDGRILLRSPGHILFAPNGNGAIFQSKNGVKVFSTLHSLGVEYLHITGVDNILIKWAEPAMVGLLQKGQETDIVCKFTTKQHALEKVGVCAIRDGRPSVIEYSIIGEELSKKTNADGQLFFNHAYLLNFMLRLDFLEQKILSPQGLQLFSQKYNVAIKDVTCYDLDSRTTVKKKGVKYEVFIHECLSLTTLDRYLLMECERAHEFAPIKNSLQENFDNPHTALDLYTKYHQHLLERAGYQFEEIADHDKGCFIHPSFSYDGEGLPKPKDLSSPIKLPYHLP